MNETTIYVPVQVEVFSEQMVRARPLGPWQIQAVGQSWKEVRKTLVRRLKKALPDVLPTDLYAGEFPVTWQRSKTVVALSPPEREAAWMEPVEIELESFRWNLSNGNCFIRLPAVNCSLFGKADELDEEVIAKQAKIALIRTTEHQDLMTLNLRFARRSFDFKSIRLSLPLGGQQEKKDALKAERKKTATLRATSSDLAKARLPIIYGLDEKVVEMADHLLGDSPQSVLIVGPSGVGKTSLIFRLVSLRDPLGLGDRRIWSTSGARIVSGMSGLGMWQQRCSKLIRQAHASRAILHLGSLFELMEAGKIDGQPGVASMVRQSIARGKLLAIAECTPEQLATIEREDPMLLRAFTRLELKEQSEAKIKDILRAAADADVADQGIVFTNQAIEELYRLHSRFATYSAMPAAPLRLIQTMREEVEHGATIEADAVARAFAKQTGLPQFLVDDSVTLDLDAIASQLATHVVGQTEPVELIVNLIATLKARLVRPGRPLATLMFIGPTGVGKTEMAKAIARLLYSDTSRMIRIDMSEYSSPWSAVKLIGKAGDADGSLTSPIREQPFSVVLLDEFEKADANVFDILLQLMGEGRLSDAHGRLADFRNAVVIMTSNLGAETFRPGNVGFGDGDIANWREHFEREVRRFVKPEFLGRIDRIVPFRPLPPETVKRIARRELDMLRHRTGLKYSDSTLEFSEAAIDLLCELGYQPKYGARPLRRAIEQNITVPLADALSEIDSDSTWNFKIGAALGRITIHPSRKSTKTRTDKDVEGLIVNAWQQLGAMARTTSGCGPLRDLENELERTLRQNEILQRRLAATQTLRRMAMFREQLQQGIADVELARRIKSRLFEVVEQIYRQQISLMVAWHRTEPIEWPDWRKLHQSQLTQLRKATEDVLRRRASTDDWISLLVVGAGEPQLEILWKTYCRLATENRWTYETFLLQQYDPLRDEDTSEYRKRVSERKVDPLRAAAERPTLRLVSPLDLPNSEPEKLADAFRHDGSQSLNAHLTQLRGFALQLRGAGVESWLDDEHGITHFFDAAATGAKRRLRFKINVFEGRLEQLRLPHDWLEPTATADRDPRRVIDLALQQISANTGISTYFAQGKLSEGLLELIREEHEQALWKAIGYTGIPGEAQLLNDDVDIPF